MRMNDTLVMAHDPNAPHLNPPIGSLASGYCRDCMTPLQETHAAQESCPVCGSHRLIRHSAINVLTIAHLDCDAFYASIEKRDNPDLRHKPVIVGGGHRGVVATACYQARLFGVRSAMPMFKALKLCPDAVVVHPRMSVYASVGQAIRERMQMLTPMVEPVSLDEAYMDLSGTQVLHKASAALSLLRLQKGIEADLGLTVSIGLSVNKLLAKIASELDKPRGFAVLTAEQGKQLLAQRPLSALHGIGPAQARSLAENGFHRVVQIQAMSLSQTQTHLGDAGSRLWRMANGLDDRAIEPDSPPKAISAETTFTEDLSDVARLENHLLVLAERVSTRAKAKGLAGAVVMLKLKTTSFETLTRRQSLDQPTQLAREIWQASCLCLTRVPPGVRFRLIGVGISDLQAQRGDATDLLDPSRARWAKVERAADSLKAKFGADVVTTGRARRLDASRLRPQTSTESAFNRGRPQRDQNT